jgi:hypothetical protein
MRSKQCFSNLKMEIGWEKSREMHSEFWELKGWTDINHQSMWVVKWGLLDSMKLKHKMKLWTTWNFLLTKTRTDGYLSSDKCTEINDLNLLPDIHHNTQVVSSIRVTCFHEIHPTSTLRPNECYSHWSLMLEKEVSCEIHTQLQQ